MAIVVFYKVSVKFPHGVHMDTVMCVKYLFLRFRQYIVKTFINQAVQIPRKADDTTQ